MYKHIVVAMDGSESSQRALDEAIHIGKYSNARLHVLFVADTAALSSYPASYRAEVFGEARRMLDDVEARLRVHGVKCETQLLETRNLTDSVARCLQRRVTQIPADVVVMGTYGRTGVKRLVLGSVAEAFLRHSTCPVLLVRLLPEA